jgi:iron-sulfur cluster repair protein YtfE (RIC family)
MMLGMETLDHIETFRAEHRNLIAHVDELASLAGSLEEMTLSDRVAGIDNVLYFLRNVLVPHALAEEDVLYPAVAAILGDPRATDPMKLDHVAVQELSQELAAADPANAAAERRLLYGLDVLIREHFRKEEELYLPLLEQQPEEYVADLMSRMQRATHSAIAS